MRAHDYSAHKRIVIVEGERVRGELVVLLGKRTWVNPLDVTIWDAGRNSGRVIYSDAFSASVEDGVCDLPEHMIRSDRRDDVLEVLDEMKAACVAAVAVLADVEIIRCDYCGDALPSVKSRAHIPTTPNLQRLGFDASKVVCPECVERVRSTDTTNHERNRP